MFVEDAQKKALQDLEQPPYLTFPLQAETRKSEMLEDTHVTLLMMVRQKLSGLVPTYGVLYLKQVENILIKLLSATVI